jgi:hypothetical protein
MVQDAMLCGQAQPMTLSLSAGNRTLIERRVLLRYAPGDDPLRFDERWTVTWTPEDGGPYPDFQGELAISMDEAARTVVVLEGSYDPPFGAAGAAFDVIAGSRIAALSARSFLKEVAARIEALDRADRSGS